MNEYTKQTGDLPTILLQLLSAGHRDSSAYATRPEMHMQTFKERAYKDNCVYFMIQKLLLPSIHLLVAHDENLIRRFVFWNDVIGFVDGDYLANTRKKLFDLTLPRVLDTSRTNNQERPLGRIHTHNSQGLNRLTKTHFVRNQYSPILF